MKVIALPRFLRDHPLYRFLSSLRRIYGLLQSVLHGATERRRTGETPQSAFFSLIDLFCLTRGRSNEALHTLVRVLHRPYRLPLPHGPLGNFSRSEIKRMALQMKENGYLILPHRLPEALLRSIVEHAQRTPGKLVPHPGKGLPEALVYDPRAPQADGYQISEQETMDCPAVQRLMADPALLNLAQAYLGCAPVLEMATLSYVTSYSQQNQVELAQYFHFDMDRIKWFKVFVFLNGVSEDRGGHHWFIRGTHRTGRQPKELLSLGYARLPDDKVLPHYEARDVVSFSCPPGTVLLEDTRGFHKGSPLLRGERLTLVMEFADSLFGAEYARTVIKPHYDRRLHEMKAKFPRIYSKFR